MYNELQAWAPRTELSRNKPTLDVPEDEGRKDHTSEWQKKWPSIETSCKYVSSLENKKVGSNKERLSLYFGLSIIGRCHDWSCPPPHCIILVVVFVIGHSPCPPHCIIIIIIGHSHCHQSQSSYSSPHNHFVIVGVVIGHLPHHIIVVIFIECEQAAEYLQQGRGKQVGSKACE